MLNAFMKSEVAEIDDYDSNKNLTRVLDSLACVNKWKKVNLVCNKFVRMYVAPTCYTAGNQVLIR